jgi:hypothetical protein
VYFIEGSTASLVCSDVNKFKQESRLIIIVLIQTRITSNNNCTHSNNNHVYRRGSWRLKEEELDRTLERTLFGRGLWMCRKTNCEMMTE